MPESACLSGTHPCCACLVAARPTATHAQPAACDLCMEMSGGCSHRACACRVGEDCTQAVKDLIMACLAEEPQQRPSALELIQMLTSL